LIKSIRHKGLRELWEYGIESKLPSNQINRIKQMLEVVDSANQIPQDFEFFKSWRIHPLKGEFKGYWSLTVNENYRLIFRFDGEDAHDLDYIDYH
jgi:proteic killer suppression protein